MTRVRAGYPRVYLLIVSFSLRCPAGHESRGRTTLATVRPSTLPRLSELALLRLQLLEPLLLVHRDARADDVVDLAGEDGIERKVGGEPVVGAPGGGREQRWR